MVAVHLLHQTPPHATHERRRLPLGDSGLNLLLDFPIETPTTANACKCHKACCGDSESPVHDGLCCKRSS
jgi:hypothetical protein